MWVKRDLAGRAALGGGLSWLGGGGPNSDVRLDRLRVLPWSHLPGSNPWSEYEATASASAEFRRQQAMVRRCRDGRVRHNVREFDLRLRLNPGGSSSLMGLGWRMAMFYLPALILDTFLCMLDAMFSLSEAHMPRRKASKPTVIILE